MTQAKRGGLGRGLAALIPTGPASTNGLGSDAANVIIGIDPGPKQPATSFLDQLAEGSAKPVEPVEPVEPYSSEQAVYREIPADRIDPNPKQPRQVFSPDALAELVHSIREFGLMQPIVVRQNESDTGRFQLVMGERRWRACQEVGLTTIPAIVRQTDDSALLRDALLENIHRVQLNPLEEAAAYQQLLDEFGVTHEELADRIGRSRSAVTNLIRLLRLPVPVQRRVAAGVLSAGHARALLGLEAGADAQEVLAARVVAEGMSVRATEEAVTLANREPEPVAPPSSPARKPIHAPGLQEVAQRLSESFDTRVTVSLGKRKGKIVVEFGSVDDLERIVTLMQHQGHTIGEETSR